MANVVHNLKVNGSTYPVGTVHYIAGTGTTAGTWLGTDNSITEYFDGLTIAYKIPIAGASTTTLNINGLGAKTVRRNTNNLTTHLPVNTVVILTYTTISGTGYWVWADYNSDTDTKVTQTAPAASGYTNWRPLVIGSSNNSKEGFTPSTVTDSTYTFSTITAQPSSGTIRATTFKGDLSGNSGTATKLATARTISLSGDASGSITFDGSADKTLTVTVADDSHNHVISNVDGLQSELSKRLVYKDVLQTTNPFGGRKLYISKIDNALYCADKRWTVTGNYTGASSGTYSAAQLSPLFDGSYESLLLVSAGCTATIRITFNTNESSTLNGQKCFPGYPYGNLYLSYYYVATPITHSKLRVYCNYEPHTIGEHEFEMSSYVGSYPSTGATQGNSGLVEYVRQEKHGISYMEFEITAPSTYDVKVTQIEFNLDRPDSSRTPFLSKYGAEKLYYPLTAPTFVGELSGNATTATTATKAIQDANGNVITSTYATKSVATTSANGLMSSTDKSKLDGIATGANKTTVDSSLSSTSTNPLQNKAIYTELAKKAGTSTATTSAAGLMSASDKTKLDGITASADSVSFSASAASGNKVGTITINGTATDMYSPTQTTVSGNAGSATKLATARTIDGMSFNGTASIAHYGTCSTAAATAAKVVSLTGFTLDTGARIVVKFTVTNTASSPTLNVNSTGAKAIYYRGSAITAGYLAANRTYEFVYNGTQWDLVGDINTDSDARVLQTATTSNASYPLLLAPSGQTSTVTTTSYFNSGVTLNPSTNTIEANVSGSAGSVAWGNVSSKPSYYDAKAIKSITRSGATFTYTCLDDTTGTFTQQDNNTAHSHSVGTGLTVSGSGGTSGTTTYSANLNSTTSLGTIGTTSKLYAVGVDANGKLCVNVPWTDTNTVYTHPSYTAHSSGLYKITVDSKGHVSEATAVTKADITNLGIPSTNTTYSTAKYNTSGLVKPAYTSTDAATLTTAAASNTTTPTIAAKTTTSGRYYAVEADKNGVLFVNVPWTYTDTKVTNNTTTSKYYLTGSTSNSNTTGTLVKRSTAYVDTSGNLVANNIPSTGLTWQSF